MIKSNYHRANIISWYYIVLNKIIIIKTFDYVQVYPHICNQKKKTYFRLDNMIEFDRILL